MLCENCQEREATIFYTEIVNGVKSEHSLCSECAKEIDFGDELPFAELLAGILGAYSEAGTEARQDGMEQVICPTCKLSYHEFLQMGTFGCEDCYGVFEPLIRDNIKKIQGNDAHLGKRPLHNKNTRGTTGEGGSISDEIVVLKERLKEALMIEDYEEAAKLRDQVKLLKERDGIDV